MNSTDTVKHLKYLSPIERRIVTAVINWMLGGGYSLQVWNGGDEPEVVLSADPVAVMGGIGHSGEDLIHIYDRGGIHRGWIYFVWGNGEDCLSDSSTGDLIDEISRMVEAIVEE